jgi:hypothetical protein
MKATMKRRNGRNPAVAPLPLAFATVSGQVVDMISNPWGFAVLQFSLFIPSGQKPVDLSTGLVIPNPAPITCNASGNFTASLQRTDLIVPDALWRLTIFPFTNQIAGQPIEPFKVLGPLNITAMIEAQLKPNVDSEFHPLIVPMSNDGTITQPQLNGAMFFDVEAQELFIRNPATQSYISIGPAAPAPPATQLVQAGGVSFVAGVATVTFPVPFSAVPVVVGTLISGDPAGTAEAVIWLVASTATGATFHASTVTASGMEWIAVGAP